MAALPSLLSRRGERTRYCSSRWTHSEVTRRLHCPNDSQIGHSLALKAATSRRPTLPLETQLWKTWRLLHLVASTATGWDFNLAIASEAVFAKSRACPQQPAAGRASMGTVRLSRRSSLRPWRSFAIFGGKDLHFKSVILSEHE